MKSRNQLVVGALLVGVVAGVCFLLSDYIGYRIVALLLLATVSLVAMFFRIVPVLVTAFLSAIIWDFFFIPPKYNLHIDTTEDLLMFLMYFVVAMVNAVLTFKLRKVEKERRNQEERQRTLQLYDTLLNSLSHELRTPIATIIGASDTLLNNSGKLTEANRAQLILEISWASFRLNQQVENLLNMSRLESGFLEKKIDWVDIAEIIHAAASRLEQDKLSHPIEINIDHDIPLYRIDGGMIEQVIYNLLFNAVNYTPEGTEIKISAKDNDHGFIMIVEDNGPGFPANSIPHVFDKFFRLKNTKAGGTGLGLSIAKGFTEVHGGNIVLENKSTGGAKFTIRIPAEATYLKNLNHE